MKLEAKKKQQNRKTLFANKKHTLKINVKFNVKRSIIRGNNKRYQEEATLK